jgi:membrane-associated phospholipid phosphatase
MGDMSGADDLPVWTGFRPVVASALRPVLGPLITLGVILVVVPAAAYAGDTQASGVDRRLQSLTGGGAHGLALALDWLGEPLGRTLLVAAAALGCLLAGRRALAVTAVTASLLLVFLTTVLKYVVGRRIHDGFLSYPSGHTAAITALGLIVGLLLVDVLRAGRAGGTAILLACGVVAGAVMAWSQITLTAHYPTDTVGGVGCAFVVVPVTALLTDRVRRSGGTPA